VVEKEVVKTVEVPGETVTKEVIKEVQVPGETVVVEKEVVKTVEVVKSVPVEVIKEVEVVGDRYILNTAGKLVEKPQYGGILVSLGGTPAIGPDPISAGDNTAVGIVYETLWGPDWAKGPAGTGEWPGGATQWGSRMAPSEIPDFTTGRLAVSWEQPDPETTIFHLRKGVYFHDRPPVNGREVVAADVAYSYSRYFGLGYAGFDEKQGQYSEDTVLTANLISVDAPDKYTVVFKHKPSQMVMTRFFLTHLAADYVYAREAVEQEGGYNDYMKMVGTGPFIIDSHVPDSATSYVRNPNYWLDDALHPENRLPYLDGVQRIAVEDLVTQVAALRAGKIAVMFTQSWVQFEELQESHPLLNTAVMPKKAFAMAMATNFAPLDDIRVRQALMMSINTEEIARELHGGYAGDELLPYIGTTGYYTPMDELPQEVQDVYTYNPEKAKQVLADAGYSEGDVEFTNYFCHRGYGGYDEWHLLINSYFAAIGVKTEMKFLDCGAYMGMMFSEDHTLFDGMGHRGSGYQPAPTDAGFRIGAFYSGNDFPYHVNDPHYDALYERWRDEVDEGSAEWNALLKEMNDYAFTQTWFLPMPSPNLFALWQPWFKNYVPGWGVLFSFLDGSLAHQWIDQELKVKMGH
jgi:peptide/nickel transport system substrate-binding protein